MTMHVIILFGILLVIPISGNYINVYIDHNGCDSTVQIRSYY